MMEPVSFSMRNRALLASLVVVFGLSILSVRLLTVQSWDRKYSSKSQLSRFQNKQTIPASRGYIVDRHQQPLAQNRPLATLVADANHLRHEDNLTSAIAHRHLSGDPEWEVLSGKNRKIEFYKTRTQIRKQMSAEQMRAEHLDYAIEVIARKLTMTKEEISEIIAKGKTRIVVKKDIHESLAREIEQELGECYIQGFSFERSQSRFYPLGAFASHILGFTNFKGIGQAGIEFKMQDYLTGRPGERILKREANGMVRLTEAASILPPILGKHVQISVDSGIQAIVEAEIESAMTETNATRASIIVVDPYTGDIWAMASRPHYDPNDRLNFKEGGQNFATQEQYEAGSVMKVIPMAAALDLGVANRRDVVNCGWGKINWNGFSIYDHHPYGDLSFDGVLMKSSNPGVVQFADRVGQANFYQYLDAFGFGKRTGFPLPREAKGAISNRSNLRNFASAAYGYSVSVSPLQVAMAYSVIANGGTLMQPRLIQSIIANNGLIVEEREPIAVRRVIGERAAREMRLALEQVVSGKGGTGRRAIVPGHRVGGKTGTAWIFDTERKEYDKSRYNVSFAGMVPVQAPKFVCVVAIEDPSFEDPDFSIGGGSVAAPVFKRVTQRVVDFLNIQPTEPIGIQARDIAITTPSN